MDESGCQGLNLELLGTSRYFAMTFLLTENKRTLDKMVKKVYKGLSKSNIKHRKRKNGVLHAYYEDKVTVKRLLNLLVVTNIKIITIRLDKRKLYVPVEKTALYSHITNTLLNKCLDNNVLSLNEPISFIASKFYTKQKHNYEFLQSLENDNNLNIEVDIKAPYEDKGLQVVDFVSWSLFQKYEYENPEYSNIISNLIHGDYELFE
jgi:hypothetical protein